MIFIEIHVGAPPTLYFESGDMLQGVSFCDCSEGTMNTIVAVMNNM